MNAQKNPSTEYQHSGLRNASVFNPNNKNNEFLEVYRVMVENDIKEIKIKDKSKSPRDIEEGLEIWKRGRIS